MGLNSMDLTCAILLDRATMTASRVNIRAPGPNPGPQLKFTLYLP